MAAEPGLRLRFAPGSNGIMVGRARLHPSADVESHWVTNPARMTEGGHQDVMTVGRIGFSLLQPSELLELTGRGSAEYRRYWGVTNAETRKLSTPLGRLRADAHLNPQSAFSLKMSDSLTRSAEPANQVESRRMLHWMNTIEASARVRPGGGALVLEAGYGYFIDYYDREGNVGDPKMLDTRHHLPEGRLMWQFLPKTALFLEATGILARYPHADAAADATASGEPPGNVAANILAATIGLRGLVTKRLSVLLKAGYGNSFVDDDYGDFSKPVAIFDVAYELSSATQTNFGLRYAVRPTSFFRYFEQLQGSWGFTVKLLDRLTVAAKVNIQRLAFGRNPKQEWAEANPSAEPGAATPLEQPESRTDMDIAGRLSVTYQIQQWATVGIHESLSLRQSNWLMRSQRDGEPTETNYLYNSLYLGLSMRY
jgi:hypothetical protein